MERRFLEGCLAKGMSLEAIGREVGKHQSTVGYWVKKHGLTPVGKMRSGKRGGRRRSRRANGARRAIFSCDRHGRTEFVLEGRGYYRCRQCRVAAVTRRRRVVKRQLVDEAGGACVLCGYERWVGALHFHHVDPADKEFNVAQRGHCRSLVQSRVEVAKCVLLCANCHAEVEGGFASLPVALCSSSAGVADEEHT